MRFDICSGVRKRRQQCHAPGQCPVLGCSPSPEGFSLLSTAPTSMQLQLPSPSVSLISQPQLQPRQTCTLHSLLSFTKP